MKGGVTGYFQPPSGGGSEAYGIVRLWTVGDAGPYGIV